MFDKYTGELDVMDYFHVPIEIPFYSQRVDFDDTTLQGFKSIEDAKYWQERGCGIASVKMIIDGFQKQRGLPYSESYGTMIYKGKAKGAHCERGWIHNGLVGFAKEYGLSGQAYRQATVQDIQEQIEQNRPCIASVTAGFRGGLLDSNGKIIPCGGHLIVVLGVAKENSRLRGLIVNHPSLRKELNWERYFVKVEDFKNSFSGAFMSFWVD